MPAAYRVFENPESACTQVATELVHQIRERAIVGRSLVLGLSTGPTLLPFYKELIYLHREESLSFRNVVTFNLAEFLGPESSHPGTLRATMQRDFFDHVDIPPENIHFLAGDTAEEQIATHCADYEAQIADAGGIAFQILGLGRKGSLGFNEPGSSSDGITRRVEIEKRVRSAAAEVFGGIEKVPTHAITMGCGTLLKSRKIVMLAWNLKKSRIVRRVLEGPIHPAVSASYLRSHPAARFFLDTNSAALLNLKRKIEPLMDADEPGS